MRVHREKQSKKLLGLVVGKTEGNRWERGELSVAAVLPAATDGERIREREKMKETCERVRERERVAAGFAVCA